MNYECALKTLLFLQLNVKWYWLTKQALFVKYEVQKWGKSTIVGTLKKFYLGII